MMMHATSPSTSGSVLPITSRARIGPYERRPAGGKRQARTAASASSRVSIIGTTTPSAPASRADMIAAGSFHRVRTIGAAPEALIA